MNTISSHVSVFGYYNIVKTDTLSELKKKKTFLSTLIIVVNI